MLTYVHRLRTATAILQRVTPHVLPNYPLWDQDAGYAGADMAGLRCFLTCPAGPAPLAARGLAAVLARAEPAGNGGRSANGGEPEGCVVSRPRATRQRSCFRS
jgi:hypothetical protein